MGRRVPLAPHDPEWGYVPVRRVVAYVEASIRHGLQWVVFEPGGEPLWARVRQQVEDFLTDAVARRAADRRPADDAFFVQAATAPR